MRYWLNNGSILCAPQRPCMISKGSYSEPRCQPLGVVDRSRPGAYRPSQSAGRHAVLK
jgi:hypothetical protein